MATTTKAAVAAALAVLAAAATVLPARATPYERAECNRYQSCNGEMCADICEIGSVVLDSWASAALASQRRLQFNRTVIQYEMPGTHNGAIAQDYEMGIEEDFLEALLLPIYGEEWSQVVIANQRHALLDQLRMGVRHVEIDVYNMERLGGFKVCHWPVCPPDFYIIVKRAAERQGMDPLDWQCSNLGCDERKPFYVDILREVRSWLDQPENQNEFVTLYIDNKNIRGEETILAFVQETESILGDLLFRPTHKESEYPDRWPTISELVSRNRRVLMEQQSDEFNDYNASRAVFFTPAVWEGDQFSPSDFDKYPDCTVNGTYDAASAGRDQYYVKQVRSLDGSLVLGPAFLWDGRKDYPLQTVQDMADCSMNVQSLDQIGPATMQYFVWSWKRDEPNPAYTCTLLDTDGRWRTADCNESHRHACRQTGDNSDLLWQLSAAAGVWGGAACPNGTAFDVPVAGRMNSALAQVANGEAVWLNYQA